MKPGKQQPRKLAEEELFAYAVKLLSMAAKSTGELRSKLVRRAAAPAHVETTIARLTDIGYLNDERFAEGFAQARRENEGFGKLRVLTDLRKRSVAPNLARKAVEHAFEGTAEDELLRAYIERRLPSLRRPVGDQKVLAAAYRKLRRAGFSSGTVFRALKQLAADPEGLAEPDEGAETEEEASDSSMPD